MSGMSETSTLFTFKCRIGLAKGFPVILRTIVQTFLIEVRLLILDTKDYVGLVDVNYVAVYKNRFDKFWADQNVMFDWTADITGTGDRSEYMVESD